MVQRAGFFHFAQSHCDPLAELAKAMKIASATVEVAGSVIVLPEGFNLGLDYGSAQTLPQLDSWSVLSHLRKLATVHGVAFIGSLIEVPSRFNSAYFIDKGAPRLICRKLIDDGYGQYNRCVEDCWGKNPHLEEQIAIGALICADAFDNRKGQGAPPGADDAYCRRASLLTDLAKSPNALLCIPAYTSLGPNNLDLSPNGIGLVLANSRPGHQSIVKDWQGKILRVPSDPWKNEVCLENLSLIVGEQRG